MWRERERKRAGELELENWSWRKRAGEREVGGDDAPAILRTRHEFVAPLMARLDRNDTWFSD